MTSMLEKIAAELRCHGEFGSNNEANRKNSLKAARAAVEAMREPTKVMIDDAISVNGTVTDSEADGCWRIMCETILTEPQHD